MSGEGDFIALMRALATGPAARGLMDDTAVLNRPAGPLVLTTDTLIEGVHYLPDDPPEDVAWKLAAVNLSDLAGKGAAPVGCLLNYSLSGDGAWDRAFARGLDEVLGMYAMPLLGGDTVRMPEGAPRSLTLTALGGVTGKPPARDGARPGDVLYTTGPVGDAGAGLRLLQAGSNGPAELIAAYRRPRPRMAEGRALGPLATAMMDVSDGLLIDAQRMAAASGVAIRIEAVPMSTALVALDGESMDARLAAACAGDDYELLVALPPDTSPPGGVTTFRVGAVMAGAGLALMLDGAPVPLPATLGYEH
ncbi:thiamine-phosphate kinase [Sphingobium subterraneum]|uniref:Thiamine-monophosphate kinase n=1 Tax=Sphingobium subterraneum TaxID=627688 RepID=A0A841J1C6_9SPHN|nr:thiamine-phosphate kinase [Sphingobium subterraneum]MBB6124460.1 thiamine-monophosphate kinase [Sphingobium subterraneum]